LSFAGAPGEDWTSVSVLDCDLRAWQELAEPEDADQDYAYSRDDH